MSIEPTSALVFGDLLLEIAKESGVAYYGPEGDEKAQIPIDESDLADCVEHGNNAIRMFISDAPPNGWRWIRPVASISLWPAVAVAAAKTLTGGTYDSLNNQTLLTANAAAFYESMEEKSIVITTTGTFVMKRYVSSTQMYVYGNASSAVARTYSVAADGDYTLPRTFAGAFTGGLSFGASTNRAIQISWLDEATIRQMRENVAVNTGVPTSLALAPFQGQGQRRRYKLLTYPTPSQLFTVEFPFDLHFDKLEATTDSPPTPLVHDETVRAACLAVVERDVHDTDGPRMAYYSKCLTNSQNFDLRSAPKRLGYFGNPQRGMNPQNFREFMVRLPVTYNTP